MRAGILLLSLLWAQCPAAVLRAQVAGGDADESAAVAQAINEWVRDFERGRIGPKGQLHNGAGLQPAYVASAKRARRIAEADLDGLTHLDVLQKLLYFAETHPSTDLADAVLGLAATGLETAFLDHEALELRELGHWSLMRMDHQGAWFLVLRAAAGEQVPVFRDLRAPVEDKGEDGVAVGPARRVAALRLLGMKALPVFRSTLEAALGDADPRVRLAAAEAIEMQRRPDSLPKVVWALQAERHPVVAQALVHLLLTLLRAAGPDLDPAVRADALEQAMALFGRAGWRTDMDLLDLVEAYPDKRAIPALIRALDLESRSPDALVAAVNERASPRLRERAGSLLRAMTGAIIPVTDVAAWTQFWREEKEHIVVPPHLKQERADGTRAEFFGVPVTGGSIAFVIDTSGSMDRAPAGTAAGPSRRSGNDTRLRAAKEQLVTAVQAMPAESQCILLTFAAKAHLWTSTPIKPSASSLRSLTELLSRLKANGGTNLYDGLATALQFGDMRYGEQTNVKIDELFLLSDGEPTVGEVRDTETLLKIVHEANKYAKVRIHCVFTGTGAGADLLRRLAEENDGVFVQR